MRKKGHAFHFHGKKGEAKKGRPGPGEGGPGNVLVHPIRAPLGEGIRRRNPSRREIFREKKGVSLFASQKDISCPYQREKGESRESHQDIDREKEKEKGECREDKLSYKTLIISWECLRRLSIKTYMNIPIHTAGASTCWTGKRDRRKVQEGPSNMTGSFFVKRKRHEWETL